MMGSKMSLPFRKKCQSSLKRLCYIFELHKQTLICTDLSYKHTSRRYEYSENQSKVCSCGHEIKAIYKRTCLFYYWHKQKIGHVQPWCHFNLRRLCIFSTRYDFFFCFFPTSIERPVYYCIHTSTAPFSRVFLFPVSVSKEAINYHCYVAQGSVFQLLLAVECR